MTESLPDTASPATVRSETPAHTVGIMEFVPDDSAAASEGRIVQRWGGINLSTAKVDLHRTESVADEMVPTPPFEELMREIDDDPELRAALAAFG